jgi:hypothetical protein
MQANRIKPFRDVPATFRHQVEAGSRKGSELRSPLVSCASLRPALKA